MSPAEAASKRAQRIDVAVTIEIQGIDRWRCRARRAFGEAVDVRPARIDFAADDERSHLTVEADLAARDHAIRRAGAGESKISDR